MNSRLPWPFDRLRTQTWTLGLALLTIGQNSGNATPSQSTPATVINPPWENYPGWSEPDFEESSSFGTGEKLVLTPYFYWYDVWSQAHLLNTDGSDALTTHPPTLTGFSYKSSAWHSTQMRDMIEAGIDVLLPVYWGDPSVKKTQGMSHWSYAGLLPLAEARDQLVEAGKSPPRIGMFYDTSTLQYNAWSRHVDLTTEYGKAWFYESIRDYFTLISPRHWAQVDGRPIIFLYSSGFAADYDASVISYARRAFKRDFAGRDFYLVREISWDVPAENVYAWGGALGVKIPGVASVGPGYDHTAVPGRDPLIVDREGGAFFERNWTRLLRHTPPWVMVETWNEFHEGTDIAHSVEYGRQYIELNRKFVDWFKQGITPAWPEGPYRGADTVEIRLGTINQELGLRQFDMPDGKTLATQHGNRECRSTTATSHGARYIYFQVDDSFKWDRVMDVWVEVEYFDAAPAAFTIQYDGSDHSAPFQGAYTSALATATVGASKTWKSTRFQLPQARLLNGQNGGADFRIALLSGDLCLARVQLGKQNGLAPTPSAPKLEAQTRTGIFRFKCIGEPGQRYRFEASQDLHQWQAIASRQMGTESVYVEDLASSALPHRFYRAVQRSHVTAPPQ